MKSRSILHDQRTEAAVDWLRRRGASEAFLRRLDENVMALPAVHAARAAETGPEREARLRALTASMRKLAKQLDADPDARNFSLMELGAAPDGYTLRTVMNSRFANRPTFGQLLSDLAEYVAETGKRPLSFTPQRRTSLKVHVVSGIAALLADTRVYKRTPVEHVSSLASVVMQQRGVIPSNTVRAILKRR